MAQPSRRAAGEARTAKAPRTRRHRQCPPRRRRRWPTAGESARVTHRHRRRDNLRRRRRRRSRSRASPRERPASALCTSCVASLGAAYCDGGGVAHRQRRRQWRCHHRHRCRHRSCHRRCRSAPSAGCACAWRAQFCWHAAAAAQARAQLAAPARLAVAALVRGARQRRQSSAPPDYF
jgi:hypothetical protein